ncbi:MAG: hypothetical protein WA080_02065 [Sulfuricurvum sp.]
MKRSIVLATALVILMSGCATPYSEAPIPKNYQHTEQIKLQAGEHWKVIANDLATSVLKNIDKSKIVYLNEPSAKSDFNEAMHSMLISAMVSKGITVVKSSANANLSIDMHAKILKFTKHREGNSVGSLTALAAGVWVLRSALSSLNPMNAIRVSTIGLAAAVDGYKLSNSENSSGETPQNEIIVTITASDKNQYLSSISNVYYTSDDDELLYRSEYRSDDYRSIPILR